LATATGSAMPQLFGNINPNFTTAHFGDAGLQVKT
jgi:hypothetical protein